MLRLTFGPSVGWPTWLCGSCYGVWTITFFRATPLCLVQPGLLGRATDVLGKSGVLAIADVVEADLRDDVLDPRLVLPLDLSGRVSHPHSRMRLSTVSWVTTARGVSWSTLDVTMMTSWALSLWVSDVSQPGVVSLAERSRLFSGLLCPHYAASGCGAMAGARAPAESSWSVLTGFSITAPEQPELWRGSVAWAFKRQFGASVERNKERRHQVANTVKTSSAKQPDVWSSHCLLHTKITGIRTVSTGSRATPSCSIRLLVPHPVGFGRLAHVDKECSHLVEVC